MSHDPTVTAAVVTVVGASGVAIVSFFTTAWSTRRTLESSERSSRAALEATTAAAKQAARDERAQRLWERRTEVYKRLVDFQGTLQHEREMQIREASEAEYALRKTLPMDTFNKWGALNVDLVTFGSDEVHQAAIRFVQTHISINREVGSFLGKPKPDWGAVKEHLRDARRQTREIVRLVRAETQALD